MKNEEYLRETIESELGHDRCALRELLFKIISEVNQLRELEDRGLPSRYDLDNIMNDADEMSIKAWAWGPYVSEDD